MSYELREYDRKYYCNSIRISSDGLIQWDSSSEADTLVVCVPIGSIDVRLLSNFGVSLVKLLNRANEDIPYAVYSDIGSGIYVKPLTVADKSKNNGTQLHIPGRGYLVLAMRTEGDTTYVYLPRSTDYSVYAESEMRIKVAVTEETRRVQTSSGLFGRKSVDKSYYKISFRPEFSSGYIDGLIYYRIGNYKIPITQQMIDHREIYINKVNDNMPRPLVESVSSQVKID